MADARAHYRSVEHGVPGEVDPIVAVRVDRWLGPWARRWFRPTLEGIEHLKG